MGTAAAQSKTLPAGGVSADHGGSSLRPDRRRAEAMEATFEIAQRDQGDAPPRRDARRASMMRRIVRAHLNYWGLPGMTDIVTLIVSELVTNAIMHSGGTEVDVKMRLQDGLLYLAVWNDAPGLPTIQKASDDAEHGRGLQLVEWMVEAHGGQWGVTSEDGTTVWCLLAVSDGET